MGGGGMLGGLFAAPAPTGPGLPEIFVYAYTAIFGLYTLMFLFTPGKMVTDHFDAPATPMLKFWIRGSSFGFITMLFLINLVERGGRGGRHGLGLPVRPALPLERQVRLVHGRQAPREVPDALRARGPHGRPDWPRGLHPGDPLAAHKPQHLPEARIAQAFPKKM